MPNKYNPKEVENEVLNYWKKENIYKKLKEYNKINKNKFFFIDGPPYPSSPVPHIGTVWNKVLKDAILRFKRLQGLFVHDQPGYDTHGLPIEVAVEKIFDIKNKQEIFEKIGLNNFINSCKDFALKNSKSLSEKFYDVGVFMDWDNPYYTFDNQYISNSWYVIKKAYEKGLLEKGEDVLHWCPRCETVLADYEVSEYRDIEDPSIYVKFKVKNDNNRYLLIWTTTPWTLPANVFVMINKDYEYVDLQINNEILIIAKERVDNLMRETGIKNYRILRTYKGSELIGLKYEHPLEEFVDGQRNIKDYHIVVDAGNFVTLYEGTGIVHSAPGHGDVDFQIAQKYNLPALMLVDDRGRFIEGAGKYKGLYVRDASEIIIKDLKEKGALFYVSKIVHRYPICWRCKTPLILRSVKQWFIRVTKLKSELLKALEDVKWIPEWGKSRIGNLIKELRDWVISRQRFWGTPLPIWICRSCGNITVVGSIEELEKIALSGVPKDLHKPWIDEVKIRCEKCGSVCERIPDVADVWFDSGVAFFASLGPNWKEEWEKLEPVDLVLEGHDQLRGWFFSLLRSGIIGFSKVPYRAVLVHGFMLDEQGREMHKSLGNYIEPSEVIERYGRDVLRLWLLRNTVWEDARFSWRSLELTKRDLQIVWNTYVFASVYMSLDNFDPNSINESEIKKYLRVEDKWVLSKFYSLINEIYDSMVDYRVHEYTNKLYNFIIEDLSRFYLKLVRKRAWVEENSMDKLALYYTLYKILKNWIILASMVTPFIAEKIYKTFVVNSKESVSLEELPKVEEEFIDKKLEEIFEAIRKIKEASLNARAKAGIKLRWPLKKIIIFSKENKLINDLINFIEILSNTLNSKSVEIKHISEYQKYGKIRAEPNISTIGPDFKKLSRYVIEYIKNNSYQVAEEVLEKGYHKVRIQDSEILITPQHVNITEEEIEGYISTRFDLGILLINKEISEEEEEEGLIRDIIRRIQFMRKQLNLNIIDYININIKTPEGRENLITKYYEYLSNETRAKKIELTKEPKGELVISWEIEGDEYLIGISRADNVSLSKK